MVLKRGFGTTRVTKVTGHANAEMVLLGQVREDDRIGNDLEDEPGHSGRRRVNPRVVDAWCNLAGVCRRWYPVDLVLHRFFITVARTVGSQT